MIREIKATKAAFDREKHFALLEKINPSVGVASLVGQVERDRIALFEVYADGLFLGVFLTRIDDLMDGTRELVILHAAAVVAPSIPMTSILNPLFDQVARDHGLPSIRVHSDKKGLDRILAANKYEFVECVYRKVL